MSFKKTIKLSLFKILIKYNIKLIAYINIIIIIIKMLLHKKYYNSI